jgi:hypothetical protein
MSTPSVLEAAIPDHLTTERTIPDIQSASKIPTAISCVCCQVSEIFQGSRNGSHRLPEEDQITTL